MSILRASVLTLLLVIPTAFPSTSFARPNDGRYQRSVEAAKKQACADMKLGFDVAEQEADKRAGTKAATPYAKQAVQFWADAANMGCNWAS